MSKTITTRKLRHAMAIQWGKCQKGVSCSSVSGHSSFFLPWCTTKASLLTRYHCDVNVLKSQNGQASLEIKLLTRALLHHLLPSHLTS